MSAAIQLREPIRKRRRHAPLLERPLILPIPVANSKGIPVSSLKWPCYDGLLRGNQILITNQAQISALQRGGCFGDSFPSSKKRRFVAEETDKNSWVPVIDRRRYERRQEWRNDSNVFENKDGNCPSQKILVASAELVKNEEGNCEDSLKDPVEMDDPYPLPEILQLSLVDAFFMMYALGCLSISDENGTKMDANSLWDFSCSHEPNFVPLYITYHYFRSKGWVVKSGLNYGTDYLLYKDGPPYYHASYSVVVQASVEDTLTADPLFSTRHFSWAELAGFNRVTEHVSKEVLFLYVVRPSDLDKSALKSPTCISSFQVQEILLRRWTLSEERETAQNVEENKKEK